MECGGITLLHSLQRRDGDRHSTGRSSSSFIIGICLHTPNHVVWCSLLMQNASISLLASKHSSTSSTPAAQQTVHCARTVSDPPLVADNPPHAECQHLSTGLQRLIHVTNNCSASHTVSALRSAHRL